MHDNIINAMKRISAMRCENQNHVSDHVQELDVFNNVERNENAILDDFLTYLDKKKNKDVDDDIMAVVPYEKIQDMPPIEEDYNVLFAPSQGCFIEQKAAREHGAKTIIASAAKAVLGVAAISAGFSRKGFGLSIT
ncbi:hypothetical protein L7F22_049771, partial [Adiantum nelumboides]|nr:hypothetical protein [Adiantum nelumboides]